MNVTFSKQVFCDQCRGRTGGNNNRVTIFDQVSCSTRYFFLVNTTGLHPFENLGVVPQMRTAMCSSTSPLYWTGKSHPAKETMRPPWAT